MALSWADFVWFWANWVLLGALVLGVIATFGIIVSGNVKDAALKREVDVAHLQIAKANESAEEARAVAAEANKAAESERVERLKLEAAIAPRRITDEQKDALVAALKPLSGHRVSLSSYAMDAEGLLLRQTVVQILVDSGFNIVTSPTIMPFGAIRLGIHVTATTEADRPFAHQLATAIASNTSLIVAYNPQGSDDGVQLQSGGSDADPKPEATLLVGLKPPPR